MAQLHSGVYVCIEGAADEVAAGVVAVRANGRFSSPFRDRRFRLRVLADVARSTVEARGVGGSGIVRVLQPTLAAEPTDAERIAFPTTTLSGIIAGGRGKV